MKRVICFGTFDILHPGHIAFLRAARSLGTELTVVVSRDERRLKISGNKPLFSSRERMETLRALKTVNRVMLGHSHDPLYCVRRIKPNVIALGKDQSWGVDELKKWCTKQSRSIHIIRIGFFRRARYATNDIKKRLCHPL